MVYLVLAFDVRVPLPTKIFTNHETLQDVVNTTPLLLPLDTAHMLRFVLNFGRLMHFYFPFYCRVLGTL